MTGEFILPQVIEAAKSSPEGGFVEYYFDDPTDDTDRADIPKVGYAREFAAEIRRADGSTVPADFIVGSGFYGRAPDDAPTVTRTPSLLGVASKRPKATADRAAHNDAGEIVGQWHNIPLSCDQRGASLSSGVYITRLSYPGGVQTQRLLYLK